MEVINPAGEYCIAYCYSICTYWCESNCDDACYNNPEAEFMNPYADAAASQLQAGQQGFTAMQYY